MSVLQSLYDRCLFLLLVAGAGAWGAACPAAERATLEVVVEQVDSTEGRVVVALYDSPETFLEQALTESAVPIAEGRATALFEDLPPGTYGVSAYHDRNGNDKMDRNLFGFPLETYAFSNQAPVRMAPPTWEDAQITLTPDRKSIVIRLGDH
ncbi:hypothetical protein JCM17960_22280 [Magnetospira thiophila]